MLPHTNTAQRAPRRNSGLFKALQRIYLTQKLYINITLGILSIAIILVLYISFNNKTVYTDDTVYESQVLYTTEQNNVLYELDKQVALKRDEFYANKLYSPPEHVAFVIPVTGQADYSINILTLVQQILNGGAKPSSVYIYEDVYTRFNQQPTDSIQQICTKYKINCILAQVARTSSTVGDIPFYSEILNQLFQIGSDKIHDVYDYAVLLNDNIVMAPDTIKYFFDMSRVMYIDDTVFAVSAYNINSYKALHWEPNFDGIPINRRVLNKLDLSFRRTNHIITPGLMLSRSKYSTVATQWLTTAEQYNMTEWSEYFNTVIGTDDCIYPDVTRIQYIPPTGNTHNRIVPTIHDNNVLSTFSTVVNYGDLTKLTSVGYKQVLIEYMKQSIRIQMLEQIQSFRYKKLVVVVDVYSDNDGRWNNIMQYFGLLGIQQNKQYSVYDGTVVFHWLTNTVMLIAQYSTLLQYIPSVRHDITMDTTTQLTSHGCYADSWARTLPYLLPHMSTGTLTPLKCTLACMYTGHQYAGIQMSDECWCGSTDPNQMTTAEQDQCNKRCMDNSTCGGELHNSVYSLQSTTLTYKKYLISPGDAKYIVGNAAESCTDACTRDDNGYCHEQLFPLLQSCEQIKNVVGRTTCQNPATELHGLDLPVLQWNSNIVWYGLGRLYNCDAKPRNQARRICVCTNIKTI